MLIDEADIYIRQRNNDMHHNAIVGTMLIALERQNVLTFMATNRKKDVDEAILSRCIAIVNFRHPNQNKSAQIWNIQSKQMGLDIDSKNIHKLVDHYCKNEIKTSGRDIRALLKLAYRYKLRRNSEISYDLIVSLGAFKGF